VHSCWCILLIECGLNSNFYLNSNLFELEIEKIRNRKRKAKPKTQLNPRPRPGPLSLFPVTAQHSPLQPSSFPRGPASFFPQPARARHLPSPLPGLPRLSTSRSSPATHPYPARYTRLPTGPARQRVARIARVARHPASLHRPTHQRASATSHRPPGPARQHPLLPFLPGSAQRPPGITGEVAGIPIPP